MIKDEKFSLSRGGTSLVDRKSIVKARKGLQNLLLNRTMPEPCRNCFVSQSIVGDLNVDLEKAS